MNKALIITKLILNIASYRKWIQTIVYIVSFSRYDFETVF